MDCGAPLPWSKHTTPQFKKLFPNKMLFFKFVGGNVPSILHQVSVPIIENEKCQNMFTRSGHKKIVRESFLCAGYDEGKKDSCEVTTNFVSLVSTFSLKSSESHNL